MIHGVLLAAGGSRRFGGGSKLAARFDGVPLLQRACEAVAASALDSFVVVLGCEAATLRPLCSAAEPHIRINRHWEQGQSTSVIAGLSAAPHSTEAALFLVADQPLMNATTIDRLLAVARAKRDCVVRPIASGSSEPGGSPVIFPRSQFQALHGLRGDRGGRRLLRELPSERKISVEVDAQSLIDVDTPAALEDLEASYSGTMIAPGTRTLD